MSTLLLPGQPPKPVAATSGYLMENARVPPTQAATCPGQLLRSTWQKTTGRDFSATPSA
jgi:hypothetical protein